MDKIIFDQLQLDSMNPSAVRTAVLCDNSFVIPMYPDVCYSVIGDARVVFEGSPAEAEGLNIRFKGFIPEFSEEDPPAYANVPHGIHPAVPAGSPVMSSYAGSFASSFSGSFSTSFTGSFYGMYEYEYEYEIGSFAGSFSGSFAGSFSALFRPVGSYAGSAASVMRLRKNYIVREIAVNGYGLNLI